MPRRALSDQESREVRRLARHTAPELIQLARLGLIPCASLWMALKAAQCFRRSVFRHGVATAGVQQARLRACQECRSSVVAKGGRLSPLRVVSCGPLATDRTGAAARPTCGCVVAMADPAGNWTPAGKTVIAQGAEITVRGQTVRCSSDCPQGRFGSDGAGGEQDHDEQDSEADADRP